MSADAVAKRGSGFIFRGPVSYRAEWPALSCHRERRATQFRLIEEAIESPRRTSAARSPMELRRVTAACAADSITRARLLRLKVNYLRVAAH